jgi:hypothetical protein
MRIAALALMGALGLAVSAVSASAAPAAPSMDTPQAANIIQSPAAVAAGFTPIAGDAAFRTATAATGRSREATTMAVDTRTTAAVIRTGIITAPGTVIDRRSGELKQNPPGVTGRGFSCGRSENTEARSPAF